MVAIRQMAGQRGRRRDRLPHSGAGSRTRALRGIRRVRIPRSGPAVLLYQLVRFREFGRLIRAGDVEAAAALVQPWQVAVSVAAGVIVSYLTVIACVLAVRRFGPGPLSVVLGVGLVTPLRWLGAIPILVSKVRGRLRSTSNTDEGWLAALTGIPESLLLLLGLTCLLLGYWFLVTAIPRGRRMRVVVPTLVGSVAVGGPLWVLWLGPLILP